MNDEPMKLDAPGTIGGAKVTFAGNAPAPRGGAYAAENAPLTMLELTPAERLQLEKEYRAMTIDDLKALEYDFHTTYGLENNREGKLRDIGIIMSAILSEKVLGNQVSGR